MKLNKNLIRLAAAVALTASVSLPVWGREYLELVGDADKAIAESRWDDAIESLDRAMRENPSNDMNVLLLSNTGMLNYYAGRDSMALERLDLAHRMAPRSVTVLCNRGQVLTSLGRLDAALRDYDTAIALDSTAVEPRYYRGMLLLAAGDSLASADMEALGRIAPNNLMTHEALAIYGLSRGEYADALPHYSVLLENGKSAELYAERAICKLKTGDYGSASDDISYGTELDENCAELYVARALYDKLCYRNDDAMDNVRKAIDLGANQLWIKELLGL